MSIRTAAVLVASITVLLINAAPALAGTLTASPSRLSLSTPVGTTTEGTVTLTNTGPRDVELTGAFLTYKPYLTPNNQTQLNAFEFFTFDCGLRILARGESCSYTIVFQPGVYDSPVPEPGTIFRARVVQETSKGPETFWVLATVT